MKWNTGYQWCEVRVVNGDSCSEERVLKSLRHILTVPPLGYKTDGKDAVFYIDDVSEGQELEESDWKHVIPGTRKCELSLKVTPCNPRVHLDEDLIELIKKTVKRRYDSSERHLDLAQFHRNSDLAKEAVCSMTNPAILKLVLKYVVENFPNVESIDLSDNKIMHLDQFQPFVKDLARNARNLEVINLNYNLIPDLAQLRHLASLPIKELKLKENPVSADENYYTKMIGSLKKFFPKLKAVTFPTGMKSQFPARKESPQRSPSSSTQSQEDTTTEADEAQTSGRETSQDHLASTLPPDIKKAITDIVAKVMKPKTLPVSQSTFLCTNEAAEFVEEFIRHYYTLYDGDDRTLLRDTYHKNAMFSLFCILEQGKEVHCRDRSLATYLTESRNLLGSSKCANMKALHIGNMEITRCLSELPKTEHDPQSFTVDLPVYSNEAVVLNVTGLFREKTEGSNVMYFNRIFVLVCEGDTFEIVNEQMVLRNATDEQKRIAFREEPETIIDGKSVEHDTDQILHAETSDVTAKVSRDSHSDSISELQMREEGRVSYLESDLCPSVLKRTVVEENNINIPRKFTKLEKSSSREFSDNGNYSPASARKSTEGSPSSSAYSSIYGQNKTAAKSEMKDASFRDDDDSVDHDTKKMMVDVFSKTTKMKPNWSRKCLADNHWDMKEALNMFSELDKLGRIPSEAFQTQR